MEVSEANALEIQSLLATKVLLEGSPKVNHICGVDVAYDQTSDRLVGAAVMLDADTLDVTDSATVVATSTFEYVPGLFSFRETPPLLDAIAKLKQTPDLVVCDGHGYAHPRRIGLASHLGVILDTPTIGEPTPNLNRPRVAGPQ